MSDETVGSLAELYLGNLLYALELAALSLEQQDKPTDAEFYRGIARKLAEARGRAVRAKVRLGVLRDGFLLLHSRVSVVSSIEVRDGVARSGDARRLAATRTRTRGGGLFAHLGALCPVLRVLDSGVDVVHRAGTWAAVAFLLGGLLTLIFTLSQAELGAAFPLAGGDYATVGNALGPRYGFIQFGLVLFQTPIFLALSAVGVSLYVRTLAPGLPATGTAIAALVASAAIAVLNIRTGAKLTGAFLAIELGALALLTVLGIAHPVQSLSTLVTAPVAAGVGGLAAPTLGAIVLAIVAASYATAGAAQAIYFSEEMHDPEHRAPGMIIAALTVLLEVLRVWTRLTWTI